MVRADTAMLIMVPECSASSAPPMIEFADARMDSPSTIRVNSP
ncbi:Uncharacterised protein [Mycobacteroides abscessus subsp. abscessus]|nr:Uncharacterised protein [Mycobacteroides abscessus subsp. abscessus]